MKNYKIIIAILVVVILGVLTTFYISKNPVVSPNLPVTDHANPVTTTPKKTETQITFANETVKVLPDQTGQGNILLVDGESRILFGNSGSEKSVPDVVFGDHYSLNDIHKINYLPIRKKIGFYSKGYFITLKNLGCNTETRFTDVPEVWVTDCSINISSKKTEAPVLQIKPFTKDINTNSGFNAVISGEPLIYGVVPRLSLMHWTTGQLKGKIGLESGSMTSYSIDTPWDASLITAYGIETIRYTAEEIFNKQSKNVTVGPMQVKSEIKSFNCRVIYRGADGGETQQCDDIIITLFFSGTNGIIKLNSYSE